jgi:CelD/BcsL family acetyltransferase involved in cellulose biosynthesis
MAFEYGYTAKSVYHAYKIGYDEAFARCSPGHLLMWQMLRCFAGQANVRTVNCMGPLDEAISKWATRTQRIGRAVISNQRLSGRLLLTAYKLRRMMRTN